MKSVYRMQSHHKRIILTIIIGALRHFLCIAQKQEQHPTNEQQLELLCIHKISSSLSLHLQGRSRVHSFWGPTRMCSQTDTRKLVTRTDPQNLSESRPLRLTHSFTYTAFTFFMCFLAYDL